MNSKKAVLVVCGNTLKVSRYNRERPKPGKRGKVTKYSDKSRVALLDAINRSIFSSCTMITFTFHENIDDKKYAYSKLRAWQKRMKRKGFKFGYFWKLERQERGALHFHLFCLDVMFDKSTAVNTWADVVDADDKDLRKYGCQVGDIIAVGSQDLAVIAAYVAKYTAKDDSDGKMAIEGRVWGQSGVVYAQEHRQEISSAYFELLDGVIHALGGVEGRAGDTEYARTYLHRLGHDSGDNCNPASLIEGVVTECQARKNTRK